MTRLRISCATAALFFCGVSSAAQLSYLSQSRSVQAYAPSQSQSLSANDFAPFDQTAHADGIIGPSFYAADATQTSALGPSAITMTGLTRAQGTAQNALAVSQLDVTFETTEWLPFRVAGFGSAAGMPFMSSSVELSSLTQTMYHWTQDPASNPVPFDFRTPGAIPPGQYHLVADFRAGSYNNSSFYATNNYSLTFSVPEPSALAIGVGMLALVPRRLRNVRRTNVA